MSAILDRHALDTLVALQRPGKPDIATRVITLFEGETPKAIDAIAGGVESVDLAAVRAAAHSLKSSSAYVGATQLSERCRDLERAARDGNLPECLALADGLDTMFDDVMQELRGFLVGRAA